MSNAIAINAPTIIIPNRSIIPPSPPAESRYRDWRTFLRDHVSYSGAICLPGVNEGRVWRPRWNLHDLSRWFAGRSPCASMFSGQVRGSTTSTPTSPVLGMTLWVENLVGAYQDTGTSTPATATNDPVAHWLDQSGNTNALLINDTANKWRVSATTLNGHQGIENQDGSRFRYFNSPAGIGNTSAFTLFLVNKFVNYVASGMVLSGNSGAGQFWWDNGANHLEYYNGSIVDTGLVGNDTGFHYYSLVFNGASSGAWKDGVSISTGNPGTNTKTALKLGTDGGSGYQGIVMEVLWYSTALGTTDRQTNEAYFAGKYGL